MTNRQHLQTIAVQAMRERGLEPDIPQDALAQAAALKGTATTTEEPVRDLRALLWCSIDNDDSRDLDQLSVAETLPGGDVKLLVAIADVDASVAKGSPVDRHAARNTTSVYTPAVIFPMLPERLSTDLTSLNDGQDRLSVVIEFVVSPDGVLKTSDVYGAVVHNKAKLAYNGVGAWLVGGGALPPAAAAVAGMDEQLRIQDRAAQALDKVRAEHGALGFQTIEVENVFEGDTLHEVREKEHSRAMALIANLMIAANGVTARFLDKKGFPSLRRVVKSPERWDRIRALAEQLGDALPPAADSIALAAFLDRRKAADPATFPDLSTSVIRLLGRGEYVVDPPGAEPPGHFGLAVRDYSHSTAPNRRFPDLVTQRLVKAALASHPSPYGLDELEQIATQCTKQEDAANKVERQVRKSAAAMVVQSRVGDIFDSIVTGASNKGTFVRVKTPPIEGKLLGSHPGLDVGDRLRVRLSGVNIDRGFIDFRSA
ncbi:MAG TPA: RNB domain-containing ribonuclease [Vicinamibacterales bacterium]|jgi:exoribonuclease-2|nr:RNB domain-containing ribonuclease [Vicinamibacterales bacterium]